ncbi:MAG: hypothetical protein H6716_29805 [Polyangiaceae bacterium]|nr:hypothetical protein [Polyangiaceae bacterium]
MTAEWPADTELDTRKILAALHRTHPIRFAYLQPAAPAERRRRPPRAKAQAAFADLVDCPPDALHAALLADLVAELGALCPVGLEAVRRRGWRLLDAWPDAGRLADRLEARRCSDPVAIRDLLEHAVEADDPAPVLEIWQTIGVADDPMRMLRLAALGGAEDALDAALGRLSGWGLGRIAHDLMGAKRFEAAWRLFDRLGDSTDRGAHNNALWSIQADNSGLGVQPERARRYLQAALPHGPRNPSIFYNAACVLIELEDVEACLRYIRDAVWYSDHALDEAIRAEPLFRALVGTEGFERAFDVGSIGEARAAARVARDAERNAAFAKAAAGLPESPEGRALVAWVRDLERPGEGISGRVQAALLKPPRTVEEIGFYPGSDDTPFERCYRFAVAQLREAGYTFAREDKYVQGILQDFVARGVPEEATRGIKRRVPDRARFVDATRQIEAAFEARGERLACLWTAGGDHLYFIVVSPEVAERWRDVPLGTTSSGAPLGLRSPCWHALYDHLGYALGWPNKPPPLPEPAWRGGTSA